MTTHVVRSGSANAADVAEHVLVQVGDPGGFDDNPGHAVSGTVVASFPS